ncbi:unnamed protein product [Ectocarpus sp. CCAP 1310/34]|nr:unnamed protein product [Ectocarpus sp. CCAP 1310/34]
MWSFRGWGGSSQQEEQAQNDVQQQQQPQEEEEEDDDEDDEYEEDEDPEETRFIERMLADVNNFGISFSQLDQRNEGDALRLLGWACKSKAAPDVINKIGDRCTDLSAWSLFRLPALQIAVQNGHLSGVKEMLRMGADVNSMSGEHIMSTALHEAVGSRSLALVKPLLRQDELEVDVLNRAGQTPLYLCVGNAIEPDEEDIEIVYADMAVALIKRGADVNKGSPHDPNETPLLLALRSQKCIILAQMLKLGKKPPAPVVEMCMKHLEGSKGNEAVLELLENAGWGRSAPDDARTETAERSRDINEVLRAVPPTGSEHPSTGNPVPDQTYTLHDAVRSGNLSAVEGLLSTVRNVNAVGADGGTALHLAATIGRDDIVEALIRTTGILVDKVDNHKRTALFRAVSANHVEAVKTLLKAGASCNDRDRFGYTPLQQAVKRPAGAIMEALLDAGASPGLGGEQGFTPLHNACEYDAPGTVEALLRAKALPGHCWNKSLQTPLLVACKRGNLGAVRLLLPHLSERQVNMRSSSDSGAETPLSAAITCEPPKMEIVDIVEALLKNGADPHMQTSGNGVSAIFTALILKPEGVAVDRIAAHPTIGPRVVRALVAGGADINDMTFASAYSPLHVACIEGACAEVIQELLDLGADLDVPCVSANSLAPLHLAAGFGGNLGAIRLLMGLPNSGGLNAVAPPPNDRVTILYLAVQNNMTEVVRFLLEEGADMDMMPNEDDGTLSKSSMIEYAAFAGSLDSMNLLIQAKMFKDEAEEKQRKEKAGTAGA